MQSRRSVFSRDARIRTPLIPPCDKSPPRSYRTQNISFAPLRALAFRRAQSAQNNTCPRSTSLPRHNELNLQTRFSARTHAHTLAQEPACKYQRTRLNAKHPHPQQVTPSAQSTPLASSPSQSFTPPRRRSRFHHSRSRRAIPRRTHTHHPKPAQPPSTPAPPPTALTHHPAPTPGK